MRVWTDEEKTLNFAKMLEKAGCQLLAVHGRTKEMKGINVGVADWKIIKKIKFNKKINYCLIYKTQRNLVDSCHI